MPLIDNCAPVTMSEGLEAIQLSKQLLEPIYTLSAVAVAPAERRATFTPLGVKAENSRTTGIMLIQDRPLQVEEYDTLDSIIDATRQLLAFESRAFLKEAVAVAVAMDEVVEDEVAEEVADAVFFTQAVAPGLDEYPTGHDAQVVSPAEEYVPVGHAVHEAAPAIEYVPAVQTTGA